MSQAENIPITIPGTVAVTIGDCRSLGERLMVRAQDILMDNTERAELRTAARAIWRLVLDLPDHATITLPAGEV